MNPATTEFLRQRFTDYYKNTILVAPSSLEQREWGFVLFSPQSTTLRMRRHIGFSGKDELFQFIKNLVPSIPITQRHITRNRMPGPWQKRAGAGPI